MSFIKLSKKCGGGNKLVKINDLYKAVQDRADQPILDISIREATWQLMDYGLLTLTEKRLWELTAMGLEFPGSDLQ